MAPNHFRNGLIAELSVGLSLTALLTLTLILIASDVGSRANKIQSLQNELRSRTNALKSLVILRDGAEKTKIYSNLLETALPNKDEVIVQFPKDLNSYAKINQIGLGFSFGAEKPSAGAEPGSVNFDLTISSASFGDTIRFLKTSENSRYFINWESLDLARSSENKQKFSGLISGKIFNR